MFGYGFRIEYKGASGTVVSCSLPLPLLRTHLDQLWATLHGSDYRYVVAKSNDSVGLLWTKDFAAP